MKFSVVIPAFNEEKDIRKAIHEVAKTLPDAEVIVVNDASKDRTAKILEEIQQKSSINLKVLTNKRNKGHGFSVVRGLKEATGDSVIYIDADRQIALDNLIKISPENFNIFDVISGIRVHRNDKLFRKITSVGLRYTILFRHCLFIKDSNCPFKIYKRESLQKLLPKLPKTLVIPIACLEVLARKEGMITAIVATPHKQYAGTREGFLQVPNLNFFRFVSKAFKEIVKL